MRLCQDYAGIDPAIGEIYRFVLATALKIKMLIF